MKKENIIEKMQRIEMRRQERVVEVALLDCIEASKHKKIECVKNIEKNSCDESGYEL